MKNINQFINESKYFKLEDDERNALSEFIGIISNNLGTDEDQNKYKAVIDQLNDNEMKQLNNIYDLLSDKQTYKVINNRNLIDNDRYRLKKIYHILDDNDLFDEEHQWDLINAFETILGLN